MRTKTDKCRNFYISLLDKDLSIIDIKNLEYIKKYSEYITKKVQAQIELIELLRVTQCN